MENIKEKKKKRLMSKILAIILLLIIIILFGTIIYLNAIPITYTLIGLLITLVITLIIILFNFNKRRIFRVVGYFLSIIMIILALFIEIYLINTLGFLGNITNGHYTINNYNVIVLNSSHYSKIKDLNNTTIGIYKEDEALKKMQDILNKKITVTYNKYESKDELLSSLLNESIPAIILETSELSLLEETNKDTFNKLKVIDTIEIKNDISDIKDVININKDPFNVYISGIDTYGDINAVSRSDVNLLVSVNPKTNKILITWIPRDYFVDIDKGMNDKLTHAGMYGIDTSIKAIEKLLDVDINYYVKVNFTSVIKIVDVLNGITIYNDETFTTNDNITFKKGYVTLNGEEALSFVRDRKHVTGGDIGRGKNQIKVLEALMKKALSKDLLKNYNKLLNTLDGTFVTNMDQNTIISFIKRELVKRRDWQINSITLTGVDDRRYTYSVPNQALYVMMPDEDKLNDAQEDIKEVLALS